MLRMIADRLMGERTGLLTRFVRGINAVAAGRGAAFLLALAALGPVVLMGLTRATDPDIRWHLRAGRLIRDTGDVPSADPFSYTAYGLPWVDVAWLFQAGASHLFERGGLAALSIAATVLFTGLCAFLYARCLRESAGNGGAAPEGGTGGMALGRAGCAGLILLVALASQDRLVPGPALLSWLLMALGIAAIDRALRSESAAGRRVVLWLALPAAGVLWVNLDVGFVLGPAITLLALVAMLVAAARPRGVRKDGPTAPLALAFDLLIGLAIQAAVLLLNPHGARAIRVPFEHFFDPLGARAVLVAAAPDLGPILSTGRPTPALWAFGLLAVVTAAALAANLRRVRPFDLMVAAATGFLALRARGNIPVFAVAAAPIVARNLSEAMRRQGSAANGVAARAAGPLAVAAVLVAGAALAAGLWSDRLSLRVGADRYFGLGAIPDYFPEEAAAFVAKASLPGQVFHPWSTGGFLIDAWAGDRRVFIDGRNDPFLHGALQAYLGAVADPTSFEAMARKYQIMTVLWPHQRAREGEVLLRWLAGGHGWTLIHLDHGASVWARDEIIVPGAPSAGDWPKDQPAAATRAFLIHRLAERPFDGPPIREIALADYLSMTGDAAGAVVFLRRAVEMLPPGVALRRRLEERIEGLERSEGIRPGR
jgi:hypothetical protein